MPTNRDLYIAISGLTALAEHSERSLEEYLRCLCKVLQPYRECDRVGFDDFLEALTVAFTSPVPGYDSISHSLPETPSDYEQCEQILTEQISDLKEMKAAGTLDDDQRYFGVTAPSGRYWYNFDPLSYLECACTGSFGGWREGDSTGRGFVPGECAYVDEKGEIRTADPRSFQDPVVDLATVSWDDLCQFFWAGQNYE